MTYQERFVRQYWCSHYSEVMPKSGAQWEWVIKRIEVNFGRFFEGVAPDTAILDVPCGVGYLAHYLLPRGFTKIHAVDASAQQIRVAEEKLREHRVAYDSRVRFILADGFEHLRQGQRYGVIAAIDFLEHLPKEKILEFLDLCFEALEPGGLLMTRVSNAENPAWGQLFFRDFTHETPFTRASLRQCLIVAGFEPVMLDFEVVPLLAEHGRLPIQLLKGAVRRLGLTVLGRFLGVPAQAFTEDLVAVGRKA